MGIIFPVTAFAQINCIELCPIDNQSVTVPDLAIDKQVSINGEAYTEADTNLDSALAYIGQTISWKINVISISNNYTSNGATSITVSDLIPNQFTFQSFTTTVGSYDQNTGVWLIPLPISSSPGETITIVTKASTASQFIKNTAALTSINSIIDEESSSTDFSDGNIANNSNDAVVTVQTKPDSPHVLGESTTNDPHVLGASTLATTGQNNQNNVYLAAILITLAFGVSVFRRTKFVKYNIRTKR